MKRYFVCLLLAQALVVFAGLAPASAQRELGVRATGSGGPLIPEQAAYDVKSYDLALHVDPAAQSINGVLTARVRVLQPINWFVLDLDPPLMVDAVALLDETGKEQQLLKYERREGKLWIALPTRIDSGANLQVRIAYNGKPRVAPRPPWVGGFVWSKTASGEPWVGVACQNDGADLWFPVKDHPSDEPETVSLHFTVPQPLVAVSNGVLQGIVDNSDGTRTFNWRVSNPINNYDITLNVAPYKTVGDTYVSVSGDNVPIIFWVLPEDFEKAPGLVRQTKAYLKFFEEYLGPYPFRREKLGIAETSYLGMEHQTIISYGNNFKYDADGLDWLMFHELGHEWWGNLVTASDWRDFWLHEGFQSFMDTFYLEKLRGRDAYLKAMAERMKKLRNMQPVAPRQSRTTVQMYMAAPDYLTSDGDIYGKGAVVLHTLRYLIGDSAFFTALRRMAYPDPSLEKITDGRQVRFATTNDFIRIAEAASGMDLEWFFEVYVRQPKLPQLTSERSGQRLTLRWVVPGNLPFPMPVEVQMGNSIKRYPVVNGSIEIAIPPRQNFVTDPEGWLLKASQNREQ